RNELRVAGLRVNAVTHAHQADLPWAMSEWIGTEGEGQLGYFSNRTEARIRLNRITEGLGLLSLASSVFLVMGVVLVGNQLPDAWIDPLLATMGALLLIYGIRQAYAFAVAESELIKQYRFMLQLFKNARQQMDASKSSEQQRQILRALGRAALDEHSEWLAMHRSRAMQGSDHWRKCNRWASR
ncbi:MAG: hypothetical protein AAGH65_12805, partial [Pseudomonadota bacterium]